MSSAIGGTRAAALIAVLCSLAVAHGARAALLYPPQPHPDAAPPGASVRVDGFPELDPHCPGVAMWLSHSAGITALDDPKLIPLTGAVTVGKGLGQKSAGDLVDVPVFTFTVPSVAPGDYLTYYSCPGSPTGWDSLFQGAQFTVLDPLPGTDMKAPAGHPPILWLELSGLALLALAALLILRRRSA